MDEATLATVSSRGDLVRAKAADVDHPNVEEVGIVLVVDGNGDVLVQWESQGSGIDIWEPHKLTLVLKAPGIRSRGA